MKLYFRYKEHPGDFFRDTSIQEFPNPLKDEENFLIWFHPNYQSDELIAEMNDLYVELDKDENDKKVIKEIAEIKEKLFNICYENFYNLILENKIEFIEK